MAELDTPPSGRGPNSAHRRPQQHAMQYAMDQGSQDGWSDIPNSAQGFDRPDQTVFDLSMEYSDDDVLLDWEQYTGMKQLRFCGRDCSWVLRWLPFAPVAPEWWYRFSRRQRKLMLSMMAGTGILVMLIIAFSILAAILRHSQQPAAPSNQEPADAQQLSAEDYARYSACTWSDFRLPAVVAPSHYRLALDTMLEEPFDVTGQVEIDVTVQEPTPCIVLHVVSMQVTSAALDGQALPVQFAQNVTSEQWTVRLAKVLQPGTNATLALGFSYTLSPGLSGFYRSTFSAQDGTQQIMATTHFEASGARRAFPCLDEPALKASFEISLTVPAALTALSNMPVAKADEVGNGMRTTLFQASLPMSTYLVAFIVGNLTSITTTVAHPVLGQPSRPVSIYGTPDRAQQLEFALNITAAVLPAFEALFGVPFTLPKLDLVAIPDFSAGAMENWGLITYRETALLINPVTAGIRDYRYVANVIAHEMTHQWFGDLVTMDYWGELWLNEGFATYFEEYGGTAAQPSYRFYDSFYASDTERALVDDAKAGSTHPLAITEGVSSDGEIESFFDGISYQKGGSVLRMLRAFLNRDRLDTVQYGMRRSLLQAQEDPFIAGLQRYLTQHSLGTATSTQLWEAVAAATGEDVGAWMQQWTYQQGYPLINVTLGGAGNDQVYVSQVPFTSSGAGTCNPANASAPAAWWVPLAWRAPDTAGLQWGTQLTACAGAEPVHTLLYGQDWLKLNAGQYGFYRVQYPLELWRRLAAAAAAGPAGAAGQAVITAPDLAGLLDDAWALSQAGMLPIAVFLELCRALGQRLAAEHDAWGTAIDSLIAMKQLLLLDSSDPDCTANLASFVTRNLTGPWLAGVDTGNGLGVNMSQGLGLPAPQSSELRLTRPQVLALAAEFDGSGVRPQAGQLLQASLADAGPLEPDVRLLIYRWAVAGGDASLWEAMRDLYAEAADASEKEELLLSLAYTTTPALTQQTLAFSLDPLVRSQDMRSLVAAVARRGGASLGPAWDFVRRRYDDLQARLGGDTESDRTMGRMVENVASNFATQAAIDELEAVSAAHPSVDRRYFESARASVETNMKWLQTNAQGACEWLRQPQ